MADSTFQAQKFGGRISPLPVQWLEGQDKVAAVFGTKFCLFSTKTGYQVNSLDLNCQKIVAFQVSSSRNYEEAYVLEENGRLTGIDLRSNTVFQQNQIDGVNSVICAQFTEDASKLFILDGQHQLLKYKIEKKTLNIILQNEANQSFKQGELTSQQTALPSAAAASVSKDLLILAQNESILIVAIKNVLKIVEIEDKRVFRTITHPRIITALAASPSNVVVGDEMGKITYYYNAFEQTDFTSSSVHWHSLSVKALSFNKDSSLLFSGGEEGVLVVWHQLEDKRDFYPRLGSEILQITVSPQNEIVSCSLRENSIQFLKVSNFETQFSVQGFTDPSAYPNSTVQSSLFLKRINQNEDSHLICLNSLPGRIQFLSLFEERRIKDIDIVSRNLTSRSGSYLPDAVCITSVAFDSNWKNMATVSQRESEEISLSTLKFWHESSHLSFEANTRIEGAHGNRVFDVVGFTSRKTKQSKFVSIGSDNKFKVWKKHERKVPDYKEGDMKVFEYFWNCEFEGEYKNKQIVSVQISSDEEDNDILNLLAEDVYLQWNISSNVIQRTLNVGISGVKKFEVSSEMNQVYLLSNTEFRAISCNSAQVLYHLELEGLQDLVYEKSLNLLTILASTPTSSVVLTLSTRDFSVVSAYALPKQLLKIFYSFLQTRKVLVGLDGEMDFFLLDESFKVDEAKKYLPLESNEDINHENGAYTSAQSGQSISYLKKYQSSLSYKFRQEFQKISEFYSEKSHLIPPSTLVFNSFYDALLINNSSENNEQNQNINSQAKQLVESDSSDMEEEFDEEEEEVDNNDNEIIFEKQGIQINQQVEQLSNGQSHLNSVSDKWIKDIHSFIEKLFSQQNQQN